MPLWLTDFNPISEPSALIEPPLHPNELTLPSETAIKSEAEQQLAHFRNLLGAATTADQVRTLMAEFKLNPTTPSIPAYTSIALCKLLDIRAGTDDLIDLLSSPLLSLPGTRNVEVFLRHGQQRWASSGADLYYLRQTMRRILRLGLASDAEVLSMFTCVHEVAAEVYGTRASCEAATAAFFSGLWKAISSSPVRGPSTLDGATVNALLVQLSKLSLSDRVQQLTANILSTASPSQLQYMSHGVSLLFVKWLAGTKALTSFEWSKANETTPVSDMIDLLVRLPADVRRSFISSVTTELELQGLEKSNKVVPARLILPWMAVLTGCRATSDAASAKGRELQALESILARPFTLDRVAPYLEQFEDERIARFILQYFVRHQLEGCAGSAAEAKYEAISRSFEALGEKSPGNVYLHLVLALHQNQQAHLRTLECVYSLLKRLSRSSELLQAKTAIMKHGLTIKHHRPLIHSSLPEAKIQKVGEISPASALRLFENQQRASRVPVSLDDCPELATALIKDGTMKPQVAYDLLKRQRDGWQAGHSHSTSPTSVPVKESRVRLVHAMAMAYARASHVPARVAYRFVMRCYKYLHSRRAGLRPEMARALAHAGVTRPLQEGEWVSTVKLRFVLDKVRQLEGPEAAASLDETVFHWRGQVVEDGQRRRQRGETDG